jgi:hypothetical protein
MNFMHNFRSLLLAAPLAAALSVAGLPLLGAAQHAAADGVITVSANSSVVQVYGEGLPAYDTVDVQFVAPDGESFDAGLGETGATGHFILTLPTSDFLDIGAGYWTVYVGDEYDQSTSVTVFIG